MLVVLYTTAEVWHYRAGSCCISVCILKSTCWVTKWQHLQLGIIQCKHNIVLMYYLAEVILVLRSATVSKLQFTAQLLCSVSLCRITMTQSHHLTSLVIGSFLDTTATSSILPITVPFFTIIGWVPSYTVGLSPWFWHPPAVFLLDHIVH